MWEVKKQLFLEIVYKMLTIAQKWHENTTQKIHNAQKTLVIQHYT